MSFLNRLRSDKITKSLTDLLDTIKSWCNSLFALDNNTVHKTTNETLTGIKVFKSEIDDPYNARTIIGIRHSNIHKGNFTTSGGNYASLHFLDDSTDLGNNWEGRLASIESYIGSNNNNLSLICFQNDANILENAHSSYTNPFIAFRLGYDSNGVPYATVPSTSTTRTDGTDVVTRNFIPSDTRILHTTGNEDFSGNKYSTSCLGSYGTLPLYHLINTKVTKGSNPASTSYSVVSFQGTAGKGSNDAKYRLGALQFMLFTSGTSVAQLGIYKNVANGTDNFGVVVEWTGSAYNTRPSINNTCSLGTASYKWTQLFANTATINTSDERFKNSIDDVPDEILNVWEDIHWKQFKMNDAVAEKGQENARIHAGLIAQEIQKTFKSKNIDISKYAFFCHDQWEETKEEKDENGNVIAPYNAAGDQYSLRYEEILCIEAAYQRKQNKELRNEIQMLKEEIKSLKELIANK